MSYLVDTHILLWTLMDTAKLSHKVRQLYASTPNIQASNINFWEISLKYRLGKLDLGGLTPDDIYQAACDSHFKIIDIDSKTMASLHKLPLGKHKDPFDRMLIWHAIQHHSILISRDSYFDDYQQYGLKLLT